MERVEPAKSCTIGSDAPWPSDSIEVALHGLAEIHAAWLNRDRASSTEPWLPPRRDPARLSAMRPLWIELARYARRHAVPWQNTELSAIHERLARDVDSWASETHGPHTLIHNDFNPRNITLRAIAPSHRPIGPVARRESSLIPPVVRRPPSAVQLCVYDWELATIGLPQRDLAEFLAFAMSPHASRAEVTHWVDRYRDLLEKEAGSRLDRSEWLVGFRSALAELLVDRLAMYAMVDRFRPQRFLTRVAATWLTIYNAIA